MADNITVDNATLTDYKVKTTEQGDEHIQHMLQGGLAFRMDEGATYTYIGEALPGALAAAAEWRIKRLTNATNAIEWAGGNSDFVQVWDDRASLIYS